MVHSPIVDISISFIQTSSVKMFITMFITTTTKLVIWKRIAKPTGELWLSTYRLWKLERKV